jgi:hypothetical protein
MRRTISILVCVFMVFSCAGLNAQIPERVLFQPGSYAESWSSPRAVPVVKADGKGADDASKTEWEKRFSPQVLEDVSEAPYEVPYLTYAYNRWTGRFHLAPYEPGYAANPSAFPKQTSPLHIWVSSKSSAAQPSPQVPYMSYYDPDPVILPAEIRSRGSKFGAILPKMEPMPLPVPKPETAQFLAPPAKTRFGERLRQNHGQFIVP